MKRLLIAFVLLMASPLWACDKGCVSYAISPNQSVCACDQLPDTGKPAVPSEEKPRRGQVPEWQDGTVHAFISKPKPAPVVEIPETAQNHRGDLIPADKE